MTQGARNRFTATLADTALAAVFVVVSQVELHTHPDDGYQHLRLWLDIPLVFLMTAPLAWRRIRPVPTLLVMLSAVAIPSLVMAHTIFFWGSLVPLAIATYTAAGASDTWPARAAWAVGPVVLVTGMLHMPELRHLSDIVFGLALFALAWAIGRVLRALSRQRADLEVALAQLAEDSAAREEQAVEAERRRIGAEMHDVVAHAITLMVVQVGAARMQLDREGVAPPELSAAEETGRQALAELRRTLGLLRRGDTGGTLQPLPNLMMLDELVEQFRRAGVAVRYRSDGAVVDLPAAVQVTAYRIVQEALTNCLKHAGAVDATVDVALAVDVLKIAVRNAPGTAAAAAPAGHGIAGMRERVAMFGGELRVGATVAGGFEVVATLPVAAPARARVLSS